MAGARPGSLDPEVGALIPIIARSDGLSSGHPSDLDRYARLEFRDRDGTWLLGRLRECPAESAPCEPENDGRLLRRLVQAIASVI